jgi:hypothetical protein
MESKNDTDPNDSKSDMTVAELAYWVEFGCWVSIILYPILYWINGPAVSFDQFVVRSALLVISMTGAIGLRLWKLQQKQKKIA